MKGYLGYDGIEYEKDGDELIWQNRKKSGVDTGSVNIKTGKRKGNVAASEMVVGDGPIQKPKFMVDQEQAELGKANLKDTDAFKIGGSGKEIKTDKPPTVEGAIDQQTEYMKASDAATMDREDKVALAKLGLGAAAFTIDVINANNAYSNVEGQARMNIQQAKYQAADAIYRGRQAQMDRQSEGYNAGQDALLAMAAQGQDVNGAAVKKIQGSYEAVGIMNGMREELNGLREAFGFELEEINYDLQIDQADIARDQSILSGALNFGMQAAGTAYTMNKYGTKAQAKSGYGGQTPKNEMDDFYMNKVK